MIREELLTNLRYGDISRLARLCGRSPSHMRRVLYGERPAGPILRRRLAKALGIAVDELPLDGRLGGSDNAAGTLPTSDKSEARR